jgi:hypothetical protein
LSGHLQGLLLHVKWTLKFALWLVQPTTFLNIKAYKYKEMTDEKNSKTAAKSYIPAICG